MDYYWLFALGFAPGIFWLWYFYKKDELEPEPKSYVIRMFFYGMLIVIPSAGLEMLLPISPWLLLILGAPVIEELGKFFVVRLTIYKNAEFDEPMDGIIYAAAVALGFASLENFGFILVHYLGEIAADEFIYFGGTFRLSIIRAFLAVPGHVLFSAMWGFALGITKFMDETSRGQKYVQAGLLLSILLHGLFNSLCLIPFGALILLVFMYIVAKMLKRRILTALVNSPHAHYELQD